MKSTTDESGACAEAKAQKQAGRLLKRLRKLSARIKEFRDCMREFDAALAALSGRLLMFIAVGAWMGVLAFTSGCDSTDGDFHTPITGMSVEKAYRIAGEAGYIRQQTKAGGRWMHVVQLEQLGLGPKSLMALNGAPLLDAQLKQAAVFESLGRTDRQMARAYNAAGIAWAKVGDGAIATAVMSGIVAGVVALTEGEDDGSSESPAKGGQQASGTTINQIQNSPGATINNDGGEGGQTGGGSGGSAGEK